MKTEQFKERYLAGCSFWNTEHYFYLLTEGMDTMVAYVNGVTAKPAYDPHSYYHLPKRRFEFARQTKTSLNNHNSIVYA